MATKAVKRSPNAVEVFKDVMQRASLSDYFCVNRFLLSISPKGFAVLMKFDDSLLDKLMEDEEFKKHVKEIDINVPEERALLDEKFIHAEKFDKSGWVPVDAEKLYSGERLKITLDNFAYSIEFNKDFLPLKLKKAEYTEIEYGVFSEKGIFLGVKKKFITKDPALGDFIIMRMYQVI